jgi:two-component system, OmpR family, response regulator
MSKILVVEDDGNLRETLKYNLHKEGYTVVTAADGAEAVTAALREKPDLIVLDVMLPKMNGFEVCRIVRSEMTVPILMLTAKVEETDKIAGLELGADDYVTKPFSVRELLARIRAMLRRSHMTDTAVALPLSMIIGDLKIDTARHSVTRNGNTLELSPKEYDLLVFLTANKGIVFSRGQLLEKVWGYEDAGDTRTIDVHIRWLRQKIEPDASDPTRLVTVRGAGYKLEG